MILYIMPDNLIEQHGIDPCFCSDKIYFGYVKYVKFCDYVYDTKTKETFKSRSGKKCEFDDTEIATMLLSARPIDELKNVLVN